MQEVNKMQQAVIVSKIRGNILILLHEGKILVEELQEDELIVDIEPDLEIKRMYEGEPEWDFEGEKWIPKGDIRAEPLLPPGVEERLKLAEETILFLMDMNLGGM